MRCAVLALVLWSAGFGVSHAALTGQIAGTVVDERTQAPLEGVSIAATSPSGQFRATSDGKGAFTLLGVLPDTYTLSFELKGYEPSALSGVTVVADSPQNVRVTMARELRTIGRTLTRRNASSAFQNQTEDSYTVGPSAITALQGKAFNSDEKSLLQKLPSVTLDNEGTVFIRGGETFQVGYQLEGIDYTEPNRTLQNKSENVGNFDLINGVAAVQLIPGGGDASHGNTGTGLISLQAKRGTYPGSGSLDLEATLFPYDHQLGFEYGAATPNNRFSYYVGFTGIRKDYQYGQPGTPGFDLGIFTDATNLTSINGANSVGVISTASNQQSNDILTNFIYKFGKGNNQSLQLFYQNQLVRQGLSYNGIQGQCYASCNPYGAYLFGSATTGAGGLTGANPDLQNIVPLFPGQSTFNQNVGSEDAIFSPFAAYKFEYNNNLNSSTYLAARYYRTFSDQVENRPSVGIDNPENGGDRSAFSFELNKQLGKHFIQIGGQYEFVSPFGTLEDVADYEYGYFGSFGNVLPQFSAPSSGVCLTAGGCLPTSPVVYDFLGASTATCNQNSIPGTVKFLGFGVNGPGATINNPTAANLNIRCGYLSQYFPGGIPRLPAEIESPMTKQQIYGYFLQDRFKIGNKATAQLGLRFDGYNFLFPDDPQNPPSIATVEHQRLFEPHVGLTRTLTPRDSLRATFGRTLSVPLPGLSGNSIVRGTFSAFDNVPSYDNLTGQPAHYCGLNLNQACANYGDQLFWLMRDTRFPNSQLAPVRGSTFTNYDFTYSHEFPSGVAFSLTPFYRRGYDIVEQSTTLSFSAGANPVPVVRPAIESNLGVQKATGIEALVTYDRDPGLSVRWSATYLNQLGNDPPLNYLSTASLELGNLYRSQLFSPIQTTLALVYKVGILRFNPIFTYEGGYPYGLGSLVQVILPNGQPANVYNTNIPSGVVGNTPYCYVDPQYSGTITHPNIAACNGVAEKSSAGGLLSKGFLNADFSVTLHAPGSRSTIGVAVTNVFNQLYGIPFPNPYFNNLIATGVYGPGSGYKPGTNPTNPGSNTPNGAPAVFPNYAYGAYPFLLLPNRQPLSTRLFYQVQL